MATVKIDFAKGNGLVPVIVQDYQTRDVLMVAYMNEEAWQKTQETGKAHYYSRSRKGPWFKGEESGNFQEVKDAFIDCDHDTLLLQVNQIGGAACHEGYSIQKRFTKSERVKAGNTEGESRGNDHRALQEIGLENFDHEPQLLSVDR